MKKVLIIEDEPHFQRMYEMAIGRDYIILPYVTIREVLIYLDSGADLSAIVAVVLDGFVPFFANERRERTIERLLPMLRLQLPNTPIIAASSDRVINQELQNSGCTHVLHEKSPVELGNMLKNIGFL